MTTEGGRGSQVGVIRSQWWLPQRQELNWGTNHPVSHWLLLVSLIFSINSLRWMLCDVITEDNPSMQTLQQTWVQTFN
uniref:Uncharacterized protein n=1 Tax=Ciona savignyi TaxID=51511 RepID=H2YVR2_CIOSA